MDTRPSGRYYNQIPDPPVVYEGYEARIANWRFGNGAPNDFFCTGADEAQQRAGEGTILQSGAWPEKGDYQILKIEDRCRTVGCGNIPPDGKYLLWATPKYSSNCYPWGHGFSYDNGNIDFEKNKLFEKPGTLAEAIAAGVES